MAFGNDEAGPALYIALGDDANPIVAQDYTDELRGKIIRIDVDGPDNIPGNADDDALPDDTERNYSIPPLNPFVGTTGDDEIIAYGLRSPWRPHLDASGRLFVADAGEVDREEVSIVDRYRWPANFGWVCTEGTLITNDPRCFPGPHPITLPAIEYTNINNNQPAIPPTNIRGCAIVGGPTLPSNFGRCLAGQYLFADYCTGDVFTARFDSFGAMTELTDRTQQLSPGNNRSISWISSFGQTQSEVFVCDSVDGEIFQILPETASDACPRWCNDIDFDNNGSIFDPQDIESFLLVYSEGPCLNNIPLVGCDSIDFNNDTSVFDPQDIAAFLSVYSEGPCF